MQFNPALLIPILAIIGIFIIPAWSSHQRKMLELRLKAGQNGSEELLGELKSLKAQLVELRDTTTRYDMSFDAALQRIESRVGNLENRVTDVEQSARQTTGRV